MIDFWLKTALAWKFREHKRPDIKILRLEDGKHKTKKCILKSLGDAQKFKNFFKGKSFVITVF